MSVSRPYVLSIAGFDPSGGAGVVADIKTFESNKVYGLGVLSANTIQNDHEFKAVEWIPIEKIVEQIELLKKRHAFEYVKIGLIRNMSDLSVLIDVFKTKQYAFKIIWDPVLTSSSGFEFHTKMDLTFLEKTLPQLFLITPNIPEVEKLGPFTTAAENAQHLSKFCPVFLKGGHRTDKTGYDTLYLKEGNHFSFRPKIKDVSPKHGSGCVLSSSITANLAKGETLHRSCLKAKTYTAKFLQSNKTLLGFHKL